MLNNYLEPMACGKIDLDDCSDVMLIAVIIVGTSNSKRIGDIIRLHKMAFLMDKIMADTDLDDDLDFGPDKFGPFSENLEESINMLSNWGIFKSTKQGKSKTTALTEDGYDLLKLVEEKYPGTFQLGQQLNNNLEPFSTNELVKMIYRLYPSQTINSLIKNDLISTSRIDSFVIDCFSKGDHIIMTENGVKLAVSNDGNEIIIEGGEIFA